MTVIHSQPTSSITYPQRTIARAERAVQCSPFEMQLLVAMRVTSVSLQAIAGDSGVQHQYTRKSLSELATEDALLWLIQVGVLRREVDGQGLTDSFRLTPLGRQLVDTWQLGTALQRPSWRDRLLNRWSRLFRWV